MGPDMPAQLACGALQLAILQRQPAWGSIIRTDRGSEYASAAHRDQRTVALNQRSPNS
jgi:transposase InsO family protein